MEEKFSSNSKIPKEFIDYLHVLIEAVITQGENIEKYKKWLNKYCIEYGVDYKYIETELNDFFELFNQFSNSSDKVILKMLNLQAQRIYLTSELLEKLIDFNKTDNTELTEWNKARKINSETSYLDFITKYPNSKYKQPAEEKLDELEEQAYWQEVLVKNTISSYRRYLKTYPTGKFAVLANEKMSILTNNSLSQTEEKETISDENNSQTDNKQSENLQLEIEYIFSSGYISYGIELI